MKISVATLPRPRQHLSADGLLAALRSRFGKIPDARTDPVIPLGDGLMSGLAVFALKDPSLLAFEERRSERNLRGVFGIGRAPSDTQMREILDTVDPGELRAALMMSSEHCSVARPWNLWSSTTARSCWLWMERAISLRPKCIVPRVWKK